jgi:hypothetical protein
MRKIISAFCFIDILAVLAISGCGKSDNETVSLPEEFSLTAEITDRDFVACAEMTRLENGWKISVSAPESLEGMQINLTDADCKIAYRELSYTAANDELPTNSPLRLTAQLLDKCVNAQTSGTVNGADYAFVFEGEAPQSLTVGGEIEVKFSDYKKAE